MKSPVPGGGQGFGIKNLRSLNARISRVEVSWNKSTLVNILCTTYERKAPQEKNSKF